MKGEFVEDSISGIVLKYSTIVDHRYFSLFFSWIIQMTINVFCWWVYCFPISQPNRKETHSLRKLKYRDKSKKKIYNNLYTISICPRISTELFLLTTRVYAILFLSAKFPKKKKKDDNRLYIGCIVILQLKLLLLLLL